MSAQPVEQNAFNAQNHQIVLKSALALIAGAVSVLAFAPFEWRIFAILSPALLFWSWLRVTPRQAWRNGFLFGLAQFGLGVSWVFNSIYEFGQAPAILAAILTIAFILAIALYPSLCGYLVTRYFPNSQVVKLVVVFPAMWTLVEWLRSWLFTGFPWLLFGQAHVDTVVANVIPVLGVLGASWINVTIAGLLVVVFISSNKLRMVSIGIFVAIWLVIGSLGRIQWVQPRDESLTISMVQGNIPQDEKWQADRRIETLESYAALTQQVWSSDLVIWPESAIPAYYSEVKDWFLEPLSVKARQEKTDLLIGLFMLDPDGKRTYNSLIALTDQVNFYNKRHLVPFGEYLPFRGLLKIIERWLIIPMSDLSAGNNRPLLTLAGHPAGVSICYEDAYGNETADALPEAEFLINVSNDAWFGDSLAPHQHLEIARLRSLETGRFLLRSTNTGISAVIDAQGRIVARSPQFKTDVLTAVIQPYTGQTPFGWWKNRAIVTLLLTILLIIALLNFKRRP